MIDRPLLPTTLSCPGLGIRLDTTEMNAPAGLVRDLAPEIDRAFTMMAELESGAISNPDEGRQVGHYWLRDSALAPDPKLGQTIEADLQACKDFATKVHKKEIVPPGAPKFTDLLIVGIGGSALGPQLIADALGAKRDKMRLHFMDNTDPDGMSRTIERLGSKLKSTLVLVVSKSGGTPETRNGMLVAKASFELKGLDFAKHAVAVTGEGSKLDKIAVTEKWLARFPMYDWTGGRTSVWSAVGVLPMALQGLDVSRFLQGAAKMDQLTRKADAKRNPAMRLALMWYHATNGRGEKDMVVLPYKDRLVLFSKYLQQLVMESLGKQHDLEGNEVHQGIAVYGNKGSTDQHAYVQQLRDGVSNFFATFVVVMKDQAKLAGPALDEVEDGVTSGDYLLGLWMGTQAALSEAGRPSLSIICDKMDARTLGGLIALYERAVGLYAGLVNVNAYHQPGVEAGKKAAGDVLDLQRKCVAWLQANDGAHKPEEIARAIKQSESEATIGYVLEHLAANKRLAKRGSSYAAL